MAARLSADVLKALISPEVYYAREIATACGAKGDLLTFHQQRNGLDFRQALDELAKEYIPL